MIQIYDTLTRQKLPLTPLTPGHVKMYVCGMTVYDYCHLGHARTQIAFDVVTRYLRYCNYRVTYVRNITDIDDKIIKRALENNEDPIALTERFIAAMDEDFARLGILAPDLEPRVTQTIPEIIAMIEQLIAREAAYVASNGDVYYRVNAFANYGQLSGRKLEELRAGERVAINEDKADPLDFVLWKAAKPGEPSWGSPWGAGRPGWHIECSAMSVKCLGDSFDIHGGGPDLIFPHHENEIAQAEMATQKKYATLWMHSGFLEVNNEKMSKSLNNFFTIRDVLTTHAAEVVRYLMIASHYRSPLHYNETLLASAHAALSRFYLALRDLPSATSTVFAEFKDRFCAAMNDDFNTPIALAVLFDMVKEINRLKTSAKLQQQAANLAAGLKELALTLGLLQQDPAEFLQTSSFATTNATLTDEEIDQLIEQRKQARINKDWQGADVIRNALIDAGIILEDGAQGTTWRRS